MIDSLTVHTLLEPDKGTSITKAVNQAIAMRKLFRHDVYLEFNTMLFLVEADTTDTDLFREYDRRLEVARARRG